jgi:thiol-disulfide isomerase/thioredoxin
MPSATKRRAIERERRRAQMRLFAIVGGGVLVLALAAIVLARQPAADRDDAGQTRPVTVLGAALAPAPVSGADPAIGSPAPTIVGQTFDGSAVTIDPGATGRPTAVWFVAHWCPHCNAEVPRIVALQEQGRLPAGVDYYAVSTGVDPSAPNYPPSVWFDSERWPFPVLADDGQGSAASRFGLSSYPYLVVTDPTGDVVERHAGELGTDGIVEAVQRAAG